MSFTPINLKTLSNAIIEPGLNFSVIEINDSCLRLAINEDTYAWHYHPNSDELFIVLEGELIVEFQDQDPVTLKPNDILLIPAGVVHQTRPNGRTVNLCVEQTYTQTCVLNK